MCEYTCACILNMYVCDEIIRVGTFSFTFQ